MDNLLLLLVIAAIGVCTGIALGGVLFGLRAEKTRQPPAPANGLVEAARMWRDPVDGTLLPELDGSRPASPESLSPEQRDRLTRLAGDLLAWLGVSQPAEDPSPLPEVRPAQVAQQTGTPASPLPAPTTSGPARGKSIAAQIDEILQEDLAESPLKNRAIRLMELPGKGMVVMVGLDQYADVGSVPDAEIREAIRASVARWEKTISG
jgi:hypothetical protein